MKTIPRSRQHKKPNVTCVSCKTANVAGEAGDASPATRIGVHLPNNVWIGDKIGSKSVTLGNIIDVYDNASGSHGLSEFAHDDEGIYINKTYGELARKLNTALHEVVGHSSGRINPGFETPKETLGTHKSTIEEGRAEFFELYYVYDSKIQVLGLFEDYQGIGMAAYHSYI